MKTTVVLSLLLLGACSSADIDLDASLDAAADAATSDSATMDTSVVDTGVADSRVADTGVADGGDTGPTDTGVLDAPDGGILTPGRGDLVISELMPDSDAVGDLDGEWFELHNPSATISYSLDGCSFFDGGGTTERPTGVVIGPGDYFSFAISASPGFTPDYVYASGMRLANPPDPDSLTVACGATIVDTVLYMPYPAWPWGKGESLNLDPGSLDAMANDDVASWCPGRNIYNTAGGDRDRGTPGAPNDDC